MPKFKIAIVLCASLSVLSPGVAVEDELYRDNVVVVLDCSGSMGEPMRSDGTVKMDAAKAALHQVIRQVPESTQVGILTFSANNIQDNWIYPLGPIVEADLMAAIDRPQPGGGTPLGAFIKQGADRLLQQRKEQFGYGSYRLLVVTDGQAGDQNLVDAFAPEIISRGIALDVIGVDMQQQHTLAQVAQSYRSADNPESLRTAIEEVFAEVSQQDGSDADGEAFELLAPIPNEMAVALLGALKRSGNEPIGSRPVGGVSQSAPGTPQNPSASPTSAPTVTADDDDGITRIIVWVVFFVVFLNIIRASFKQSRKRKR